MASDQKLIYVSYFKAPSTGNYRIEALNDNTGTLSLWYQANPSKESHSQVTGQGYEVKEKNLNRGHYAIVVDSIDQGVASALIMSIARDGKEVKRTATDGSWCIFRVPANTNVKEYVPKAAACRPCFVGE